MHGLKMVVEMERNFYVCNETRGILSSKFVGWFVVLWYTTCPGYVLHVRICAI